MLYSDNQVSLFKTGWICGRQLKKYKKVLGHMENVKLIDKPVNLIAITGRRS